MFLKTLINHIIFRNVVRTNSFQIKRKYTKLMETKVHALCTVPALQDNYMYILINQTTRKAVLVDPVEPEKILSALEQEKATPGAVLTTHHHYDHCGGNKFLSEKFAGIPIYGGDDRIESLSHKIHDGDTINIHDFNIKCLYTPCHTNGHMCYFIEGQPPICFTGDTLFVSGCGRFFEGTAENMLVSLNRLSKLPSSTLVCCGHEYTVNNLKFALFVEPSNVSAQKKLTWSLAMREQNKPTVPSTILEELNYNPFMRVYEPEISKFVGVAEPVQVMSGLRKLKDDFSAI